MTARAMPWALLAAACLGMFAVTAAGSTRAPFLLDMARDLSVSVPMVANLFAVTSVAWGISSFVGGRASDRWGRRPFLVGGLVGLTLAAAGLATGQSYLAVAVWAGLGGACSGTFTGVCLAEISLRVADNQRGRALGWIMTGQSLTLLIGVPLAALIGATIGWRGVHYILAALALVAALAMVATTRPARGTAMAGTEGSEENRETTAAPAPRSAPPSLRSALSAPVIRLLASLVAERICFGLLAFYYPTFLQTTHGLALVAVAAPLAIFAIGNIGGTILGGQLADRFPNRRLSYAGAMLVSGAIGVALFAWHPGLAVTASLGFAYAFFNALARPSLMASLAEVPAEVRGAVMGLNGTVASLGWLSAAMSGGWIFASVGFQGFGPLIALLAMLAAGLVLYRPRGRGR